MPSKENGLFCLRAQSQDCSVCGSDIMLGGTVGELVLSQLTPVGTGWSSPMRTPLISLRMESPMTLQWLHLTELHRPHKDQAFTNNANIILSQDLLIRRTASSCPSPGGISRIRALPQFSCVSYRPLHWPSGLAIQHLKSGRFPVE